MFDPISFTIVAWFISHIGTVAVVLYTVALTLTALQGWIRARSHIGATNSDVIGVELSSRLANKNYVEMPGVFRNQPTNTQMVQAIYNKRTRQILDSRRIASAITPSMEVINKHAAGNGLVVYS
jgi:hypothetical protein